MGGSGWRNVVAQREANRMGARSHMSVGVGGHKAKSSKVAKSKKAKAWNSSWAPCGDGCLDKLVVSIKKEPPKSAPVRDGFMQNPAPKTAGAVVQAAPLVLLGLLSGNPTRRAMLRCTWMMVPKLDGQVRLLFVVGSNAPAEGATDELRVNVTEGERMRAHGQKEQAKFDPGKKVQTGSVTTYWKLAAFFQYAATQPEPMVGRGDDDVLISPRMLLAHAQLLLTLPGGLPARPSEVRWAPQGTVPYVYAGVFEWYSWRKGTLHSTGFGFSAGAARKRTRAPWRNCSADGLKSPPEDPCVGPIAFAKGPLMLLSSSAVRWLVASPDFHRDLATARAMAEGRAAAYMGPGSGRIDDDVQLGYWLSQLPGLPAYSKWPPWQCHRLWPPHAPLTTSEGLRLPSALGRRSLTLQTPQNCYGLGASPRPRCQFRCV